MNWPGVPELIVIAIIILLLFGGKKLKEVMRSFGEGLKEFRSATSDISDEVEKTVQESDESLSSKTTSTEITEEEQKTGPAG